MFKWLGREMGTLVPIVGLELVSLPGGPVVRIGYDAATRLSARRDGATVAGEWSGILSSRYRIHAPQEDFRLKRFPCLPVGENWDPAAGAPGVRKIECPLYHAGQVLGVRPGRPTGSGSSGWSSPSRGRSPCSCGSTPTGRG
jgi:hypothetical protein